MSTTTTAQQLQSKLKLETTYKSIDEKLSNNLKFKPIRYKGLFEKYDKFDISPYIGTEFRKGFKLKDLLYAENSDELLSDLGVYIAERGVILFRDQSDLTFKEYASLVRKLSALPLGQKEEDSILHVHPMAGSNNKHGDEFFRLISTLNDVYKGDKRSKSQRTTGRFHTDLYYEKRPALLSALKLTVVPPNGASGTVFGSGYHAYSRLTPLIRELLEKLTVYADWNGTLKRFDEKTGEHIKEERGGENEGIDVVANQPLVRTNPITGWKALFYSVVHGKYINELDFDESAMITEFIERLITENHEYLIKLRWETNDIAIWDNRSTFHSVTSDYDGTLPENFREAFRVTTLGELPYLDPHSISIDDYEKAKREEHEYVLNSGETDIVN